MTGSIDPAGSAPVRSGSAVGAQWRLRLGGTWYFVVTVVSAGLLTAIPFWHAARRLRRAAVTRLAVVYTAADVLLVVLVSLTPRNRTAPRATRWSAPWVVSWRSPSS